MISRIKKISNSIKSPIVSEGNSYEVDEIRTYIKKKNALIWIVYAIERISKKVVSYAVGSRTNATLSIVLNKVISRSPFKIFTDKLKHYKYLIPDSIVSRGLRRILETREALGGITLDASDPFICVKATVVRIRALSSPPLFLQIRSSTGRKIPILAKITR
mgnify:CR=1 FL=1